MEQISLCCKERSLQLCQRVLFSSPSPKGDLAKRRLLRHSDSLWLRLGSVCCLSIPIHKEISRPYSATATGGALPHSIQCFVSLPLTARKRFLQPSITLPRALTWCLRIWRSTLQTM